MTKTDELLKAAEERWTITTDITNDIKQLIELVRLQADVIRCMSGTGPSPMLTQQMRQLSLNPGCQGAHGAGD